MQYICAKKCYFQDRLFSEGERVDFGEDVKVPKHFKSVGGNVVVEKPKTQEVVDEENTINRLRAELEKVGKAYDRRWGITKLETELQLAKSCK